MLKVVKSGFYTTIQDSGRFGYRAYGVPVSGVMDSYSSHYANSILGNDADCAVLEITMIGPELHFDEPTQIAIAGADMGPMLNGNLISNNQVIDIKPNDVLSFEGLRKGLRCYLAIKGGLQSEVYLGSRSMYNTITESGTLKAGEKIYYEKSPSNSIKTYSNVKYDHDLLSTNILEVENGPEYNELPQELKNKLSTLQFKVSKFNNRMAYQLEPLIPNTLKTIITSPVLPGTVQLTPNGNLIILVRDCQTTGGYPRVLQLTERSLNILSQKRQEEQVSFRLTY
ncbi:5-oxoprolinase subunit C family protein [Winogradskyella vincentii]|uniref:Biotin-dependent carboxyltransferase family protein n=1 Tax=Winogradskyella vincentii TaxID=2877122 RepID=A0ABS7XZ08_9FLAO|nr:biotin-dependent carboxyltransferase family protein [Winogradskyella vincentii]MCA0152851.1 biotin-dependent carboxyltransferase family protein [Winogradskyella vincentii]